MHLDLEEYSSAMDLINKNDMYLAGSVSGRAISDLQKALKNYRDDDKLKTKK